MHTDEILLVPVGNGELIFGSEHRARKVVEGVELS